MHRRLTAPFFTSNVHHARFKFQSWRDFSKYDEHDTSQAEFREEKRWMERQNASARAKRKAKEIKRVATLVRYSTLLSGVGRDAVYNV